MCVEYNVHSTHCALEDSLGAALSSGAHLICGGHFTVPVEAAMGTRLSHIDLEVSRLRPSIQTCKPRFQFPGEKMQLVEPDLGVQGPLSCGLDLPYSVVNETNMDVGVSPLLFACLRQSLAV